MAWLHRSLQSLQETFRAKGLTLILKTDNILEQLLNIINETGAIQNWQQFTKNGLWKYEKGRDFPAKNLVSHLSPISLGERLA